MYLSFLNRTVYMVASVWNISTWNLKYLCARAPRRYRSLITDDRNRRWLFFRKDIWWTNPTGLNTVLARGVENLKDPICPGFTMGGGDVEVSSWSFDFISSLLIQLITIPRRVFSFIDGHFHARTQSFKWTEQSLTPRYRHMICIGWENKIEKRKRSFGES